MTQSTPTLFKHSKRPEWGMSVIAWERDGKRGYLFESGMLRVLAEPFYRLMSPLEPTNEVELATLNRLLAQVDSNGSMVPTRVSQAPSLRFAMAEQLKYFATEFDEGFGKPWQKKQRGAGAKRRLKRHRNAAIEEAQTELSAEFLLASIEHPTDAWLKVTDILAATDLVPSAQVEALKAGIPRATEQGVQALHDVLYGEGDLSARFDAYVNALQTLLGKAPNWELCTATLALVCPKEHVCVRRTSFQTQADWLLPEFKADKRVNAVTYGGFSHLAKMVCEQLEQNELPPQDYLDVHDFIKLTTSPSAQSRMLAAQDEVSSDEPESKKGKGAEAA